jgi:adenosylcobyric acid synthase
MECYEKLSAQHDIIVIEGAGSPVELNLKSDDIVNMGMAKLAKAPVLLVGDIDRGGVFAQLLGTLGLFEPDELSMVKGLIVNRFRGDIGLFDSGRKILEERGGKPVLGVVPYLRCDIEDEDSLSEKLGAKGNTGLIDIAVIRLPRISNFTDLDAFSQYDGVSVRYVSRYEALGEPDLIILPGTKSTLSDLRWLRTSGLEAAILRLKDTPVFGICGGYQMLGECIRDPENTEGGGELRGLGLLPGETVFTPEKRRAQVCGTLPEITDGFWKCLSCADYEGYEVHMGRTPGGVLNERGNAAGSYVHGIFDTAAVSGALVRALFARKGITWDGAAADRSTYREQQFDLLASGVRKALDMDKIYRILEEGV